MTEQELRELEFEIAEIVFGWRWYRCEYVGLSGCTESQRIRFDFLPPPEPKIDSKRRPDWVRVEADLSQAKPEQISRKWAPAYSTDRAASQEVLERCMDVASSVLIVKTDKDLLFYKAPFYVNAAGLSVGGKTVPQAICLFAKKLFGKE